MSIAAISLLGAALALFRQSGYGVIKSHDSIFYISMARNLLEGNGLLAFNGEYTTFWAPLVPILYAAGGVGVIDPIHVPGPMNAVMLGATALTVGVWARRRLESRFVAVCACAVVALGVPMTMRADYALSETPFILFATLALFALDEHIERGGRAAFLWATVFAALALATRYTGVFLVFVCCAVLITRRDGTLIENARSAALFAALPFLTMAAWLVRNYLTTGIWANPDVGERAPSAQIGWLNASEMLEKIAGWWLPLVSLPQRLDLALGAVALGVAAAVCVIALFRLRRRTRFAFMLAGFALVHFFGVVWATSISHVMGGDRFATPFYVPMILLAAFGLDRALARMRRSPSRMASFAAYGTLAALAAWTALAASAGALGAWERANGPGAGWASKRWHESETIRYMKARGADGAVWSNDFPRGMYINGDHRAAYRKWPSDKKDADALIRAFQASPPARETLIVWMRWADSESHEYNPSRFRAAAGVETEAVLSDGWVFRVNPDSPPEDPRRGALLADGPFDIYLHDRTLAFVREPCGDEDAAGGFWLSVAPVFADDLDDPERRHGMNALNFSFGELGARFGGKCAAWVELPEYDIRAFNASRRVDGEFLWGASARLPLSEKALAFYRQSYRSTAALEPLDRGEYDIYLDGGDLAYLKEPCDEEDARGRFLLSAFPSDPNDLPQAAGGEKAARQAPIHQSMNFSFFQYGVIFDGKCMIRLPMPDYPVRAIEMGRWIPVEGGGWAKSVPMPLAGEALAARRTELAALSALEPIARGDFAVYYEGGGLTHYKAPCSAEDVQGFFHLRAFPTFADDLPAESGGADSEYFRFRFSDSGVTLDGVCVTRHPLPDYPIRAVQLGRTHPGEPDVWDNPIRMSLDGANLERHRKRYAEISAREPLVRDEYDVYLYGRALAYLKEPCDAEDARGRFLLSVFPSDPNELPPDRKAAGARHMGMNFDFDRHGVIFDGKCMISHPLPDFAIESLEIGRWIPGEGEVWKAKAAIGE